MPDKLYRCVYYSKNLIVGGPKQIAIEVDSILAAARRNNPQIGITGALVFNRGIFAQVLEGSSPAVEAIFEKIQRDQRHGDIQVLEFAAASERVFEGWSMAFLGRSREDQDLFGHFGRETGFSTERIEGKRLLQVIRTLAFEEEARARLSLVQPPDTVKSHWPQCSPSARPVPC